MNRNFVLIVSVLLVGNIVFGAYILHRLSAENPTDELQGRIQAIEARLTTLEGSIAADSFESRLQNLEGVVKEIKSVTISYFEIHRKDEVTKIPYLRGHDTRLVNDSYYFHQHSRFYPRRLKE